MKKIGMAFLLILGASTQFGHGFWFFLGSNKEDDGGGGKECPRLHFKGREKCAAVYLVKSLCFAYCLACLISNSSTRNSFSEFFFSHEFCSFSFSLFILLLVNFFFPFLVLVFFFLYFFMNIFFGLDLNCPTTFQQPTGANMFLLPVLVY